MEVNKNSNWYKNKRAYIANYRKQKCKTVAFEFNLTKEEDAQMYNFLQSKKENGQSISSYIKSLISRAMNE